MCQKPNQTQPSGDCSCKAVSLGAAEKVQVTGGERRTRGSRSVRAQVLVGSRQVWNIGNPDQEFPSSAVSQAVNRVGFVCQYLRNNWGCISLSLPDCHLNHETEANGGWREQKDGGWKGSLGIGRRIGWQSPRRARLVFLFSTFLWGHSRLVPRLLVLVVDRPDM